jgi:hypothetical protein
MHLAAATRAPTSLAALVLPEPPAVALAELGVELVLEPLDPHAARARQIAKIRLNRRATAVLAYPDDADHKPAQPAP